MKIFAGLIIIIILCATYIIVLPHIAALKLAMVAEKLSNKPREYFVVTDADPVLLQAISHRGELTYFSSLDETEIDDLTGQHGTSNVEYQNNYYSAGILSVHPPEIYVQVFWISLLGLVVSTTLLATLTIRKGLGWRRRKKQQVSSLAHACSISRLRFLK